MCISPYLQNLEYFISYTMIEQQEKKQRMEAKVQYHIGTLSKYSNAWVTILFGIKSS